MPATLDEGLEPGTCTLSDYVDPGGTCILVLDAGYHLASGNLKLICSMSSGQFNAIPTVAGDACPMTAPLHGTLGCVNVTCPAVSSFGGVYTTTHIITNTGKVARGCTVANPITNACACPTDFAPQNVSFCDGGITPTVTGGGGCGNFSVLHVCVLPTLHAASDFQGAFAVPDSSCGLHVAINNTYTQATSCPVDSTAWYTRLLYGGCGARRSALCCPP
jgi:hypothetical protein